MRASAAVTNDSHAALQRTRIIILTYNAQCWAENQLSGLRLSGIQPAQVLVVDSSSRDDTRAIYSAWGAEVIQIPQNDFNHGGTRQMAAELSEKYDFLVYLTQDAIPASQATFINLLGAFREPNVGVAYGRQLPRPAATAIEAHARLFNYPRTSAITTLESGSIAGSKAVFCSDSFAAYQRNALVEVGGFPTDTFFAEDQIVAGKMLLAGYAKAYVSNAEVYHSHAYSFFEEFRRYFDVGVFHYRNAWLTETFGKAEGDGARFVRSELLYLLRTQPWRIPEALLRTACKYAGYRTGKLNTKLSNAAKRKLSASPYYWR